MLSKKGDIMPNGDKVPAAHDGMAAFKGKNNTTILVRNHENSTNSNFQLTGKILGAMVLQVVQQL